MRVRCLIASWLLMLFAATCAHAQTADYHLSLGMSPDRSLPPKVYDMSWASGGPYGPAKGKRIKVFILDGIFGRNGLGDTLQLQEHERAAKPHILMFESGRWEPFRPLGVRFGYEFYFAEHMAKAMPDETVGIIVGDGSRGEVFDVARQAMLEAPCDIVAYIRLSRKVIDGELVPESLRQQLNAPNMIVMDRSSLFNFDDPRKGMVESMHGQSKQIFEAVYEQINVNNKEE